SEESVNVVAYSPTNQPTNLGETSPSELKVTAVNGRLDVETGITPLRDSTGSQNGNAHSRGNSEDLSKVDRRSGASTGSSPRPSTLGRELPDIPVANGNKTTTLPADRSHQSQSSLSSNELKGHHSQLPDVPAAARVSSPSVESHSRGTTHSHLPEIPSSGRVSAPDNHLPRPGTHSHTQLPEIPKNATSAKSPEKEKKKSQVDTSKSQVHDSKVHIRPKKAKAEDTGTSASDDYDHLDATGKKRNRPRSDYDHVVFESGEKHVVIAKSKLKENDYAEVKPSSYEAVDEEVTVIPVSKPKSASVSTEKSVKKSSEGGHDVVDKTSSFDDPYNRIKGDDPPYNKIKEEDPPYNKIKVDDPYSMIKVSLSDDPYNTVKDDDDSIKYVDDLDPYDDVLEGAGATERRLSRRKKGQSFKAAVDDPYNTVVIDEERNVSNQTDPYARVGDTEIEIDDPYNKVVDVENPGNVVDTENILPEYGEDDYATVNKVEAEYAKVNKGIAQKSATEQTSLDSQKPTLSANSSKQNYQYSTVVKVKKAFSGNGDASSSSVLTSEITSSSSSSNQGSNGAASAAEDQRNPGRYQVQGHSTGISVSGHDTLLSGPRADTSSHLSISAHRHGLGNHINVTHSIESQGHVGQGHRGQGQESASTPMEPPRDYYDDDDDDGGVGQLEVGNYNTVSRVNQDTPSGAQAQGSTKEPPYNKLSVRESLASMNARAASNTYEYVLEVDNLYATVEGGSGDGVVRATGSSNPGSPSQGDSRRTLNRSEADVPPLPSLDSLHETAKQHQGEVRKKPDYYNIDKNKNLPNKGQGHQRTPSGQMVQGHSRTPSDHGQIRSQASSDMTSSYESRVMSSSFEGGSMSSSYEGRVPMATQENVDLEFDQNYQSVDNTKNGDECLELDPNYETVDEAKSKVKYEEINGTRPKQLVRSHIYEVPGDKRKYEVVKDGDIVTEDGKIRAHVYEEVTVSSEERRQKQKLLSQHTYEEVTEVMGQKKKGGKSNQSTDASSSKDVGKKKKGHERSGSGDLFSFGKKKNDDKDKSKESKRKTDGKDASKK
ncbi:hypothetical protein DPMN_068794, partial [Dreissena polymorpha]